MAHAEADDGTPEAPLGPPAFTAIAILFVGFQYLTAGPLHLSEFHQRSLHLGLALLLLYLPLRRPAWPAGGAARRLGAALDLAIAAVAAVACGHVFLAETRLVESFLVEADVQELVLGTLLTLIVLDAARRTTGWILPVLAAAMIAYTLLGQLIPGSWGHPGFSFQYLIEHLYLGTEALWGRITGLSAGIIAIFIIFGSILMATGAAETFMKLSLIAAGRASGGAAKVATLASAFFGMINGAAVANVATTGNFTIPAMIRLGYRKAFAGAVEAVASSGGQITPPIMGTAAFVMAELLEVPYLSIALIAVIPAFLFFCTVWFSIDVEARRQGLRSFGRDEIPSLREALDPRQAVPLLVTVVVLLASMAAGHALVLSAFLAITTNVALYLVFGRAAGETIRQKLASLRGGIETGARHVCSLVPLLVCAQIILSLISLTGIGIKLSELILSVGEGHGLLAASILTFAVSMILGMGMPTTAAYLLAAAVCVAALTSLGIPALTAHFFVFYSAILSALTPPVCTAVFTASVITGIHWWPIAVVSIRLAIMKYVLPFYFIYRPALLLDAGTGEIFWATAVAVVAAFLFAVGTGGFYLRRVGWPLRILCLGLALATVADRLPLDLAAVATAVALVVVHRRGRTAPGVAGPVRPEARP